MCGLACPLPLLKTKQALRHLPPGAALRVLATDPGSVRDFRVFCTQAGHGLQSRQSDDGVYCHDILKHDPRFPLEETTA